MKSNFSFSSNCLTVLFKRNFHIVVFLGILFDLCLIHSVLGCPERCKCTVEKLQPDPNYLGKGVTLIWGTLSPVASTAERELMHNISIDCAKVGLERLLRPSELNGLDPAAVVKLDYGSNKIEEITENDLRSFTSLKYLKLSNNRIDRIESNSFDSLYLKVLLLDGNHLPALISGVFPNTLEDISLEDNFLTLVPSALTSLHNLKTLNLASNKISVIHEGDLRGLTTLTILKLDQNQIVEIEDRALASLPNLQTFDLSNNLLTEVPSALLLCTELLQLHLTNNRITSVSEFALQKLTKLEDLLLIGNPIEETHVNSFRNLPALKKLILKESRKVTEFPNLVGTSALEMIRIDRAALQSVPVEVCSLVPRLRSLVLHRNEIETLPSLEVCWHLRLLDLSNNKISDLSSFAFEKQKELQDLLLQHNSITEISPNAFVGLSNLQVLNLEHNFIKTIHPDSFLPLISLEDINVGNNFFPEFPSVGLERVVNLKAHNNRHLKTFPSPGSFPSVHSLVLSYAYHCCPFLSRRRPVMENGDASGFIEDVVFSVDGLKDLDPTFWNVSSVWPDIENTKDFEELWADLAAEFPSMEIETTALSSTRTTTATPKHSDSIQCIPTPGPFMPCKDLFDWWTLRCGVWIVFLMALLGNGVVVIVLIFARAKMDVPRFLVTNLAMADFFMGIYLGFLAVVDASTLGEFRMYAIPWQMSSGCQAAGFFGVLSSELSVYTLTVITLERNYAITHAMHLNKRLSLRHAAYIMTLGWVFASVMATLPIIGISDYRKFAICLPFETAGGGLAYVIFLMFINGLAFIILMACYLKIYCAIRGSQAWNSNDSRIAKRMALLVFTDFLCWAPIAFFSLTAASGLQLISLEEAKIFTVFILPLNSCCNPFLYALLTKQFKKDCVMLCKTIEESRVTRGIGRCRHSSNFSNRQTPANTNSAVDQASKGDNQVCVCQSKQKEHRKLKNRLRMAARKYFTCHKENEETNSSSEYNYKQNKNVNKNKRNTSLSSETYSSSWSENFKKSAMPMSLRLLEKRRPNNWLLSRKPSNDSNLSSSRNDSSATTASTSTWRISRSSRSSVSSDISNKSSTKKEPQGSLRIGSIRERQSEVHQPSTANNSKGPQQVLVMQTNPTPGSWVSSLIKGKPKLNRQIAIERETYFTKNGDPEAGICILHKRGENLSCVYEQESYEEEETQSNQDSNVTYLTPNFSSCSKAGFIPRKLSTISSRSASLQTKESNKEDSPPLHMPETPHRVSPVKEQIFFEDGRCASLSMLSRSPIRTIAERCPSEGYLCRSHQRYNIRPTSAKSTDCVRRFLSSELKDFSNFRQSPVCTETTALMESDSEDDDVFLDDGARRRQYETHFPVEGDCEETLIKVVP